MFLSEWREFPSAPCLAGKKKLMTARVSMLLKSRESLTYFRACFFPDQAKDLSARRYVFSVGLRTNSDYFPIQHPLTGFYNGDLTL